MTKTITVDKHKKYTTKQLKQFLGITLTRFQNLKAQKLLFCKNPSNTRGRQSVYTTEDMLRNKLLTYLYDAGCTLANAHKLVSTIPTKCILQTTEYKRARQYKLAVNQIITIYVNIRKVHNELNAL